jgi:hypothetical protein
LDCEVCHDDNPFNYTQFADGAGANSTAICDDCHSPGGSYDGVNDAVIGAKANWDSAVYKGSALQPGKEEWCVGCHDGGTSVIDGVSAPNVDSFYVSGHGRFDPNVECLECHDAELTHVDGLSRTYAYIGPGQSYGGYQTGYRLKLLGGTYYPLAIPKAGPRYEISASDDFRLCLECHPGGSLFDDTVPYDTNFNNSGDNKPCGMTRYDVNDHRSHVLNEFGHWDDHEELWDSDWDTSTGNITRGGADSHHSCVTCHNVHGSTYPAMIRDGKLVGRNKANDCAFDGLEFAYVRDDGFPNVTSDGAVLSNSVGGVMRLTAEGNPPGGRICYMACHTDNPAPEPDYTAELGDPSPGIIGCLICHDDIFNDAINYFRQPSVN